MNVCVDHLPLQTFFLLAAVLISDEEIVFIQRLCRMFDPADLIMPCCC